jgi:hypothetical protein
MDTDRRFRCEKSKALYQVSDCIQSMLRRPMLSPWDIQPANLEIEPILSLVAIKSLSSARHPVHPFRPQATLLESVPFSK